MLSRQINGQSDDGCVFWRQGHENRIPHRTPTNPSRRVWHAAYLPELIHLYGAYIEIIEKRYPTNRVTWDNETFNAFSRMMYECSSGYIDKNLVYEEEDSD